MKFRMRANIDFEAKGLDEAAELLAQHFAHMHAQIVAAVDIEAESPLEYFGQISLYPDYDQEAAEAALRG